MPKFLGGNVIVKTFEVYADTQEEAEKFILSFQEGDMEEPEGGIKATCYKLGWTEFDEKDPTNLRNIVLAEFLQLMQNTIPGMPTPTPAAVKEIKEQGLIIHPFKQ